MSVSKDEESERENHRTTINSVDDFYIGLEEIGMGDIEFRHARLLHLKAAQRAVYFGSNFVGAQLKRERENTQRVAVYHLTKSDHTCVLLVRDGETEDGGKGRTFYICQYGEVVKELVHLVDNHGFDLWRLRSDLLKEDLPERLAQPFLEERATSN